ncbi:MAG TPA: SigE family RNA polymerase sigma factor [Mycobacteriales bacterium]|nr:SigE family RNA polymerase sigma factor [Mycobacteriales bacterium]
MLVDMDPGFRDYVVARSPAMLRTAYLLTGNRQEAEDLLQEALLRLAGSWRRISHETTVDAYLRRTMVNLRTSRWRKRRVRSVPVSAVPDIAVFDPALEDLPARHAIWAALSELPPRMRAVLVLRFYEDLSEVDTAAVLECSVGNVKSQTSRALDKLRAALPERSHLC